MVTVKMSVIETFETFSQYDKQFDGLFENTNNKGFSCSLFSLMSAYNFLNNGLTDKETHESNVKKSIISQSLCGIQFGMTFEELLSSFTDINTHNISATSVELINSGDTETCDIVKPYDGIDRATIILKNERYIVVLTCEEKYCVRDCHEKTQYNFKLYDDLISHMMITYQFMENVDVSGMVYSDYSSIEYLNVDTSFYCSVMNLLGQHNDDNLLYLSDDSNDNLNDDLKIDDMEI